MESDSHKQYIINAVRYIERHFNISPDIMAIDLGESIYTPPQTIDSFRPDIYVNSPHVIIIGESKTDDDIVNRHTTLQLISYIKELNAYQKEKHLVMSSSIAAYSTLRNFLRRFRKTNDVSFITFHTVDPIRKGEILI